jgi:hypothetical protein
MTVLPAQAVRPPRAWETQTLILLASVAAAAVLAMILLASDLVVRSYLLTNGESGMSPLVSTVVDNADGISLLSLLLVFAYLGGFIWWQRRTRALLRTVGDADGTAARHWMVHAWNLAIFTALAVRLGNPSTAPNSTDELASGLGWDAVNMGVRLTGLVFLLLGVLADPPAGTPAGDRVRHRASVRCHAAAIRDPGPTAAPDRRRGDVGVG